MQLVSTIIFSLILSSSSARFSTRGTRGEALYHLATSTTLGTCPGTEELTNLRKEPLPHLQDNTTVPATADAGEIKPGKLFLKVVETSTRDQVRAFGPVFDYGYRYLVFDNVRPHVMIGDGCVVQSKVACKKSSLRYKRNPHDCGRMCEPDTSVQFGYVRGELGSAMAGLVASHGKDFHPKAAAVIGVGAGSMPTWLMETFQNTTVDAVDIEDQVMKVATDCFGLGAAEDPLARLHLHVTEGIEFLKKQPQERYDLLLLDVSPLPSHFVEALSMIYDRLAPGGVLSVNLWTADDHQKPFVAAAAKAFGRVWKSDAGPDGGNEVLFAIKGDKIQDKPTSQKVLQALPETISSWFSQFVWKDITA